MTLVGLAFLVCGLSVASSLAVVVIHLVRRPRGFWAALSPLGGVFTAGFIPAAIGRAEGEWSLASPGLWIAMGAGGLGVGLQILGWRAALRPRPAPGRCKGCGYDMTGLARCPECGTGMTASIDSPSARR